jgi:putative transposase
MDWASRAMLAWRLSNTMDSSFCVCALQEALARFGRSETRWQQSDERHLVPHLTC